MRGKSGCNVIPSAKLETDPQIDKEVEAQVASMTKPEPLFISRSRMKKYIDKKMAVWESTGRLTLKIPLNKLTYMIPRMIDKPLVNFGPEAANLPPVSRRSLISGQPAVDFLNSIDLNKFEESEDE